MGDSSHFVTNLPTQEKNTSLNEWYNSKLNVDKNKEVDGDDLYLYGTFEELIKRVDKDLQDMSTL